MKYSLRRYRILRGSIFFFFLSHFKKKNYNGKKKNPDFIVVKWKPASANTNFTDEDSGLFY